MNFLSSQRFFAHVFPQSNKKIDSGIIIITGCSSGIGEDVAVELAKKQKFYIIAGVRKDSDASRLKEASEFLIPFIVDITKSEDCTNLVNFAEQFSKDKGGMKIIGLVNNAGYSSDFTVAEYEREEDLRRQFEVNFFGTVRVTKLFLPILRKNQGRIVTVSSLAGKFATQGLSSYSASKFALEGYFTSLRRELYGTGVSVSLINAGVIRTKIWDAISNVKNFQERLADSDEPYRKVLERNTKEQFAKLAYDLAPVPKDSSTPDIIHALTSSYPSTAYYPGTFFSDSARLIIMLNWLLADRIMDFYLDKAVFFVNRLRYSDWFKKNNPST